MLVSSGVSTVSQTDVPSMLATVAWPEYRFHFSKCGQLIGCVIGVGNISHEGDDTFQNLITIGMGRICVRDHMVTPLSDSKKRNKARTGNALSWLQLTKRFRRLTVLYQSVQSNDDV